MASVYLFERQGETAVLPFNNPVASDTECCDGKALKPSLNFRDQEERTIWIKQNHQQHGENHMSTGNRVTLTVKTENE